MITFCCLDTFMPVAPGTGQQNRSQIGNVQSLWENQKKTKKPKIPTKSSGWEVGLVDFGSNLWLFWFFQWFCTCAAWANTCPTFPLVFFVFLVVLHMSRLGQGLASTPESKVCHEGYHHNPHIGEEVTETVWIVSNWSQ